MKKLTILFAVFVLGSTQIFASNNPINSEQQLRKQIATLLESPEIKLDKQQLKANIEFTLNGEGEIVVLTVDSEDLNVKSFVKSRLNYKKVDSKISNIGNKVFKISLKILKPEGV
ncbi:hypothetical protein IWQ47_001452 [Aquimarina sp. EL_43]|uniref:hypothetical protein n=1 Tax=Aquimarina TaxID=290174 RepID=UPI0004702FDE|nr:MULTISPECIES: hypothetical protein [Aquimarina]MBG6130465.1 hypothetical protein [Aquimarina sp. EL_35]MBG6149245.1 hypothetical protein [Aquimarina sp. EL_32]MBG6168381.1 hypothetical protein [Aquimarina sp. EL_43]